MELLKLFAEIMGINLVGVLVFSLTGFVLSRILRRNDVADVLWGPGFVMVAIIQDFSAGSGTLSFTFKGSLVLFLTSLWALRLALYLGLRTASKGAEDVRYANWRKQWGNKEPMMAFFKVFLLQGLMLAFIALPVSWAIRMPEEALSPWDFLGTLIFLLGFLLESISDLQMAQFKRNPENTGKIMQAGLWKYSRHPNYFGEILVWWGIFLLALPLKYGLVTIISPLLITYLLTKVSGVPMLDKVLSKKGEAFKSYAQRTRSMLPFGGKEMLLFTFVLLFLALLDFLWLGLFMKEFYLSQSFQIGRIVEGQWDIQLWAAAIVYLVLSGGILFFSVFNSDGIPEAFFKGAMWGLCVYSVYEFTNISMVKNWPLKMALVDVIWGTFLCGLAAMGGKRLLIHLRP